MLGDGDGKWAEALGLGGTIELGEQSLECSKVLTGLVDFACKRGDVQGGSVRRG